MPTPTTSLTAFEVLADLLPDGLLVLGGDGIVRSSNDQLAALFGCDRADIVGRPIEDLLPERHRAAHVGHRAGFFEAGHARPMGVGLDLWARRADGTEFPVDVSLRRVTLDDEAVVVAAVRDLTEQREAERTRATLEIVRGASRSAVVVLEPTGAVTAVNGAATRLLGVDADRLVGRPLVDTVLGATAELARIVEDCVDGRHVEDRRLEVMTAWGDPLPVNLTARPVTGARGDISAVSLVLYDRSEEEASQRALGELQARLEVTERIGGIGSWEWNANTGELQMSPGLHALLGLDPLASTGTLDDLLGALAPDDATDLRARLERTLTDGERVAFETEIGAGAARRWVVIEGGPAADEGAGDRRRVVGIVQDRTAHHAALESLREADRLKDEFLSTVSHELRTPLTVIVGFAEHLRANADEQTRVYLDAMHRNASEMDLMVDQLLDMSRVQSGRVQIEPTRHELHALVGDVLRYSAHAVRSHEVVDETSSVAVLADGMAFRRVLTNLLTNAAKFSPDGSTIRITDEAGPDGEVVVSVTDHGVGLDPSDLETIFDLFVQARRGRPLDVAGTGVGLTIVRRYVEMQGGRVWVESEPGRGARFRFTIPRADAPSHEDGRR